VSENTVKTHTARLFDKLSARRRTQAVQRAKEEGLIA
jgi:ATP/maltotriose-dependent transcriptional regulator MalT